MIINKKIISKLKPCKDRFDNYIKHYGTKSFTSGQFMGLKNITQSDKMWVVFRLMKKEYIKLAAADIAETVIHIYESKYPKDDRPKKAIEAARTGDSNAYSAAASAYSASASAYSASASAAYSAAASSAYAASAAYSASASAYSAAAAATKNRNVQEKLIRKICLKYLNKR